MQPEDDISPDGKEFQDPLENYDPRRYGGPLERALAEETVAAIQSTPYVSIPPEMPIHEALGRLAALHVACLLVEKDDRLVGVFTDRDALDQVALEFDEVKDQPVSSVMTKDPVYVNDSDSSAAALSVMAVSGYRHVPVLGLDGKTLGIASPQRITAFLQRYFGDDRR